MIEEWRQAPGWEHYEVSSLGRARRRTSGIGTRAGRLLKPQPGPNGYLHVVLSHGDGCQKSVSLHRLVCEAFHGAPPQAGMHAAHKNGSRHSNRQDNLYWATPSENAFDRAAHGTDFTGSRNPCAKLTEEDIPHIRAMAKTATQAAIAARYGVSDATISYVLSGKKWSHVP